jgi:hypothetical protein
MLDLQIDHNRIIVFDYFRILSIVPIIERSSMRTMLPLMLLKLLNFSHNQHASKRKEFIKGNNKQNESRKKREQKQRIIILKLLFCV